MGMGVGVGVGLAFRAFNSYHNRFVCSSTMLNFAHVRCIHAALHVTNVIPTCYHKSYKLQTRI